MQKASILVENIQINIQNREKYNITSYEPNLQNNDNTEQQDYFNEFKEYQNQFNHKICSQVAGTTEQLQWDQNQSNQMI